MIKKLILIMLIPLTIIVEGAFKMEEGKPLERVGISKNEITNDETPTSLTTPTNYNFNYKNKVTVSSIKELELAVNNANVKTKIIVKNGTYNFISVTLKNNTSPVYIVAETQNKAIIQGLVELRGTHISFVGFLFNGGSAKGKNGTGGTLKSYGDDNKVLGCTWDNSQSHYWLRSAEGHRFESAYNTFKNKLNNSQISSGPVLTVVSFLNDKTPSEHHIHHNYFYNIPLGADGNGYDTIAVFSRSKPRDYTPIPGGSYEGTHQNVIVEYNLFEQCKGEIELISAKTTGTIIQHNTMIDNEAAISLRHGMYQTVRYNYLKGGSLNIIRVMDHYQHVHHNYVEITRSRKWAYAIEAYEPIPGTDLQETAKYFNIHDNYLKGGYANVNFGRANTSSSSFNGIFKNNILVQGVAEKVFSYNSHARLDTITFEGNKYYGNNFKSPTKGFKKLNTKPSVPSWAKPISKSLVGADNFLP